MPLEVFYSYSHKDVLLRDELDVHLSLLVREGLIVPWADRRIAPGDDWRAEIDQHVRSAQIILLLISPSFIASEYCYGTEMKIALERHAKEHAIVIPVILCAVDWQSAPFAELQALPTGGKPVTLWPNRDEAFADVAKAIRAVVIRFQQPAKPAPVPGSLLEQQIPKARMLDAAMPSHIVKDRATELLVLIRLPDSDGLKGVLQQDDEAEARPDNVRSRPFDVTFPQGPTGMLEPIKVTVHLTSPDFQPPLQAKNIFVPVDRDSQTCSFMLTPVKVGSLMVVIELVWEDAERGSRRLKTNCIAEAAAASKPVMNLVQMDIREVQMDLREAESMPRSMSFPMPTQSMAMGSAPQMAQPAARQSKAASSPFLKLAAALCVVTLGSTFFYLQNGQYTAAPPPKQSAAPALLEDRINAAAARIEQIR